MKYFILICLCIIVPILVYGQQSAASDSLSNTHLFLNDRRPSLLFNLTLSDIYAYEGGIGIALPGSRNWLWRFSVGISSTNSVDIRDDPASEYETHRESDLHYLVLSASCAPVFTLNVIDPGFVFLSPFVKLNFNNRKSNYLTTDSSGIHGNEYTDNNWTFSFGGSIGAGIAISKRIVFSVEYRLFLDYHFGETTTDKLYTRPVIYYLAFSKGKETVWAVNSSPFITLYIKL